ncbi:failed axon connections isoform X1 [Folsomia candida]|uniref:failed axon connections isoform X1 n=1 Tax=Folsomia candida TaxID=158441 RepID=UPI000B8FB74D|nr:failed axon connections isoform X1 [Folsomia candida]
MYAQSLFLPILNREIFMWAFIWGGERHAAVGRTLAIPWYAVKFLGFQYRNVVWAQGIGRHTRENIAAWTYSDIKSVATVLGNNKFLLGDEPCLEDCTLFGFCGQLFWGFPASSPYSKFAKEEYPNLYAYANRMKDRYFPDWDQLIAKEKSA